MVGTTQGDISLRLIGSTLRQHREAMTPKVSVRKLADMVGIQHSRLSRIETGQLQAPPELLARIGEAVGMSGRMLGELLADARQAKGTRWIATKHIDPKIQMQALHAFEARATRITSVLPLLIPGLLQIPAYTAAILRSSGLPEYEVEERVNVRAQRSDILIRRRNPTPLAAFIGEEALYRRIGGPGTEVMCDQLVDLLDWSDPSRPNIEIRIIPRDQGWYPGVSGGYTLLDFGDAQPPLVVTEHLSTVQFQYERADLVEAREGVDMVRAVAMSQEDSRDLIATVAHQFETAGSESVA